MEDDTAIVHLYCSDGEWHSAIIARFKGDGTDEKADEFCLKCFEKLNESGPFRENGELTAGGHPKGSHAPRKFTDEQLSSIPELPEAEEHWLALTWRGDVSDSYSLHPHSVWPSH